MWINKGSRGLCRIVFLLCSVLIVMGCASCVGRGDWEYDLPNGYTIWHVNARKIILGKYQTTYSVSYVIDNYIRAFQYNDCFVGVQGVVHEATAEESPHSDTPVHYIDAVEEKRPSYTLVYYLVDTETETTYGPYDESEYEAKCEELSITDLGEWIQTKPMPEGAYID